MLENAEASRIVEEKEKEEGKVKFINLYSPHLLIESILNRKYTIECEIKHKQNRGKSGRLKDSALR